MHIVIKILLFLLLLSTTSFSQNIDDAIIKKQLLLQNIDKTDVLKYTSTYDELAALIISKSEFSTKLGKDEQIDIEKICNFVNDYQEVEFIKTEFYKTPFNINIAETLDNVAKLYLYCYPPLAEKFYMSVIIINKNLYSTKSEQYAQSLDDLADYLRIFMFKLSDAINYYQEAKNIREAIYSTDDFRITKNYAKLALVLYYHKSDKNSAEQLLLQSLKIRQKDKNATELQIYQSFLDLANFYSLTSNFKKEYFYSEKAKKLKIKIDMKKDL